MAKTTTKEDLLMEKMQLISNRMTQILLESRKVCPEIESGLALSKEQVKELSQLLVDLNGAIEQVR